MATIEEFKNKGNNAFKSKDFEKAKQFYSDALNLKPSGETASVLLANRAACHLKLNEYKECEADCKDSLSYVSDSVKALFRLATAQYHLGNLTECIPTTKKLLQVEPSNVEGQQLMRKAREQLTKQESEQTGMTKTLASLNLTDHKSVENGIKSLIDLCKDDVYHALEFARKGGISIVVTLISQDEYRSAEKYIESCVLVLKLLALITNHAQLIAQHIDYTIVAPKDSVLDLVVRVNDVQKLSLHGLARFCVQVAASDKLVRPLIVTLMNILKHIPASPALSDFDVQVSSETALTLPDGVVRELLEGFKAVLAHKNVETYTMACDIFSAFISELPNYYDFYKVPDHRAESLEDRKKRLHKQSIFKLRSKKHADMASRCDFFDLFAEHVDDESYFVKSNAVACVGKMIKSLDDEETVKYILKPLLPHPRELDEVKGEAKTESELMTILAPAIPICRRRAALEAALLVTHPELGSWTLQQEGGTAQFILLIGTKDYRCMEIAAEVLCLAAGVESASHLLSTLVENNVIHSLLYSSYPAVRAAAASVLTKLSLKAKALSQSSEEVSQILNAVTGVLKASVKGAVDKDKGDYKKGLVSFSSYDNTAMSKADSHAAHTAENKAISFTSGTSVSLSSVERAIEVVAAIVGKTFVKEEVVHGSSRVASLIADLASLEVDPRSTAAYGLAHILASLTVTNKELKALALAEKEITVEQYEQMQELQRIKARDDDGTVVEERKEDPDNDTMDLCNLRIKRIAAHDGIKALLRLVEKGSNKTKETACKALRQMLVEHSVRGSFIQQGGLKACCNVASDTEMEVRS
ncbi:hypothetical protein EON65_01040 [archaeon]|nr:MAG: hypothetical protein EON65_01040 [archaeon]